jgi:hypothetical protein
MTFEIVIDFDRVSVHEVRNFGEVLFNAFKDDKPTSVSLSDVDRATDQLRVVVRYPSKRRVRTTLKIVTELLEEHLLAGRARVSEVDKT